MPLSPEQEAQHILERALKHTWDRLHDPSQPLEPGTDGSVKIPGWPVEYTPIHMDGQDLLREVSENYDGSIRDRTVRVPDGQTIYINDKPKP